MQAWWSLTQRCVRRWSSLIGPEKFLSTLERSQFADREINDDLWKKCSLQRYTNNGLSMRGLRRERIQIGKTFP